MRGVAGNEALVQVCADLDRSEMLAREVRALQEAALDWPKATLQIIALNPPSPGVLPPEIQLHLASDLLL